MGDENMATMKAVRIHSYGPVNNLTYEVAPKPTVGEGEILIRNVATSVNPFDCAVRAGYLTNWYNYPFPLTLGLDISGIVEELGSGVNHFVPGDKVWARADPALNGAYAEFISVQASEIAAAPKSLDPVVAAALPHVGLTAWRALIDAANLMKGQTVLIHAAAGGVGSFAVQLAKTRGANVIGTASTKNLDLLMRLGVDEAVDYTTTRFEDVAHNVDIVMDNVGGDTQDRSWATLKLGGILVSIVQSPSEEAAQKHGVRQQFVGGYPPAGAILTEISALIDSGQIEPIIASIHPLNEVSKVHEAVEARHTRGKQVIQIASTAAD
jgi:NADPH:quinone reductase-like Zn-dependent oxidoreductase